VSIRDRIVKVPRLHDRGEVHERRKDAAERKGREGRKGKERKGEEERKVAPQAPARGLGWVVLGGGVVGNLVCREFSLALKTETVSRSTSNYVE